MEILEKNNRWCRFCLPVVWHDFQTLEFSNEPFNDSATVQQWRHLGYTQTKFTGDLYDMRRPTPAWMPAIALALPWKHFSWSLYRMTPGCVLPNHRDTYKKFCEIYDIQNLDSIYRAVIFLADWQSGHYLEVSGQPVTNWSAGEGVIWQNDVEHLAANVGHTDRFTLQITGVPDENPFL